MSSHHTKYNIVGCFAILSWALAIPFVKRCVEEVGPMTTAGLEYLCGGILGLTTNFFMGKLKKSELLFLYNKEFIGRVLLFTVYLLFFFFALYIVERKHLPVLTLLNYLWPTFTLLLSVFILKQKFKPLFLVLGTAIIIFGLTFEILGERTFELLFDQKSSASFLAFVLVTIAAGIWAFYTVLNRIWAKRAGEVAAIPFVMLSASVMLLILGYLLGEKPRFPPDIYIPLLYLLTVPYLSNVCWDIGTRLGNITLLSLLCDFIPWASLVMTSFYLGVSIDINTWISAIIIVFGALISRYALMSIKAK